MHPDHLNTRQTQEPPQTKQRQQGVTFSFFFQDSLTKRKKDSAPLFPHGAKPSIPGYFIRTNLAESAGTVTVPETLSPVTRSVPVAENVFEELELFIAKLTVFPSKVFFPT